MTAQIISIANQKGGVGKTTTAVNLATALAASNNRVLIIDLDSQGNASTGLGVHDRQDIIGSYDLLLHTEYFDDAAAETEIPNLDIIPATMDLASVELTLSGQSNREKKLAQSLDTYKDNYDYILLDCPPNLGLTTLNSLVASNFVIVPLQTEFYALEGLSQILSTITRVKKSLNPKLDLGGVVLTMYDKRNKLSVQVSEDVRMHLGAKVFDTVIPRNVRIAEAPSFGAPVIIHDHTSIGARAYMMLAREVLNKFKPKKSSIQNKQSLQSNEDEKPQSSSVKPTEKNISSDNKSDNNISDNNTTNLNNNNQEFSVNNSELSNGNKQLNIKSNSDTDNNQDEQKEAKKIVTKKQIHLFK